MSSGSAAGETGNSHPWGAAGFRRPSFALARVILGLAIIAYLGFSGAIDWRRLLGLTSAWPLSLAALALILLTLSATSLRLCLLLSGLGIRLRWSAAMRLTLLGAFFSNFLPGAGGGDVVRLYLALKPNTGQRAEIATTMVLDRAIGLLALLVTPLIIAAVGYRVIPRSVAMDGTLLAAALGLTGVIILLFVGSSPRNPMRRIVRAALARVRLGALAERVFESLRSSRRNRRGMLAAFLLSLLIQALGITTIQLIMVANGAPSPSIAAALLTPLGMLANTLPLTPGGLGVGEAAFESLFGIAGVSGGAEAILSWRVLTTLIDVTGGILFVAGRTDMRMTTGTIPDPVPSIDQAVAGKLSVDG